MNVEAEFRAAMAACGLPYDGPLRADAKIHRVKSGRDKRPDTWYVLFPDPPVAGAFGSWRLGTQGKWRQSGCSVINPEALTRRKHLERLRAEEKVIRQEQARLHAEKVLKKSVPANSRHPYLQTKRVGVQGELMQLGDSLVLPLRDITGRLRTLQFISSDGTKRFLSGGRTQGCFFSIGMDDRNSLAIVEGYATGATVFTASGHQTICAMNCGNLMAVALAVRAMWPIRDIIIVADNDTETRGNPGLTHARAAALKICGRLAIPTFNTTVQ